MNQKTNIQASPVVERVALFETKEDLKTALLLISMTINLFIFTAWLVIQVDPSVSLVMLQSN